MILNGFAADGDTQEAWKELGVGKGVKRKSFTVYLKT